MLVLVVYYITLFYITTATKSNNKQLCVLILHADRSKCYNVQRFDEAREPCTSMVLLQHTRTKNYLSIQDNKLVCIPLQLNDPSCTFVQFLINNSK